MNHVINKIKEYTFLVTGGAGFIGSNLVEFLLEHGAKKVRVLDNLSTGYLKNLKEFDSNAAFEFVNGDIRDLSTCKNCMKGIDYVFHEAALGSVPRSIKDPVTTNEVNISGFLNILVAAKESECVKRTIYAASSSTYGDSSELPKLEDRIGKPLSPYAVTKFVNELYADVFSKTYGLELIGLRYFNVFGPKQNPEGAYAAVVPKFVKQLLKHESPLINGDGEFSRDFTFIDNVVQANILAALTPNQEAVNTVYNIAYGERTTLNKLIENLQSALRQYDEGVSTVKTIYGPSRQGDIPHSLASIDKAKKLLGYKPEYDLLKGLKKAVGWYMNNL